MEEIGRPVAIGPFGPRHRLRRASVAVVCTVLFVAVAPAVASAVSARPAVAPVPAGGYWEVASDGGMFSFNAPFFGSMGGKPLNAPIVGMAYDPSTGGYWEVASDGGMFSFNAPFFGSMGGKPLNAPIVGMAYDPSTGGYWEVASDGGMFSFNAPFFGSMGGQHLNAPVVGLAFSPNGPPTAASGNPPPPPPPAHPPAVSRVSPGSGSAAGGTSVTIAGTNLSGATAVHFGAAAAIFNVKSTTTVTATAPSGSGSVDVTVTTPAGTSAAVSRDRFTYVGAALAGTYRGDLGRSGFYPAETGLHPASLKRHWTASAGGGSFAQPIVANNLVYWSDWTGLEHGTDLNGHDVWTTDLGTTTPPASDNCSPASAGPTSTPTLTTLGNTPVMYVGGGDGALYALNALNGAVMWQTQLGPSPDNFIWDSPAVYNGTVYIGLASFGDCPLVQGKVFALNAATGAITHTFNTEPNGCVGGGVWGSPTVDPSDGSVYVATGNPGCGGSASLAPALIKLRASDLSVVASWIVPAAQQGADGDFGSTPTLFTATINGSPVSMVGTVDKNGVFYAFDRSKVGSGPVWQTRLTLGSGNGDPAVGSIVSAAWDGSRLYVGGGNTSSCTGTIDALNPNSGAFVWQSCQSSHMFAAITAIPGVVVEGTIGGSLVFLDSASGATLFTYDAASQIQGEATVSNGIVYVAVANGSLVALGP